LSARHDLRNKTSVPVFYRRINYKYAFDCVWIKSWGCWHLSTLNHEIKQKAYLD